MDSHNLFLKKKFNEVSKLITEESKILDIGCNNGKIISFLPTSINYYGVDIEEKMIRQLQQRRIKSKVIDLNKDQLPFQFERFDFIFLLDVLEHILDPRHLLLESKKRLGSNGKILVTLPNDYHILNKFRFLFNKDLTEDSFAPYGHIHIFPIKSGEEMLRQAGFKILKKIPISPTKPNIFPQSIKNLLGKKFPQTFARDILYLLKPL